MGPLVYGNYQLGDVHYQGGGGVSILSQDMRLVDLRS